MAKRRPSNPTPPLAADWLTTAATPAPSRALPIGAQPLFLPALVEQAARGQHVGAHAGRIATAREAFRAWNAAMQAGGGSLNESQIEQAFNHSLLRSLGYQGPLESPDAAWSMQPKWAVPGIGQTDIALGRFAYDADGQVTAEVLAVVELKGPRIDLDRAGSRARSAVQQAWDYLNAFESARWAVVTNGVEARLYSKRKTNRHVHRVVLADLDDEAEFRRFYAVFCADSLLPARTAAFGADRLLTETDEKQDAVGAQLYDAYEAHRKALVRDILAQRPDVGLDRAIEAAQTLLDRILFIAFAEDRGLLGDRLLLERVATTRLPGVSRWAAFQGLFRAFDRGDPSQRIDAYNGSLFKPDPLLDDPAFALDNERWPEFFRQVGAYDYRYEVTPDVLGNIFERSITAIEELREHGPGPECESIIPGSQPSGPLPPGGGGPGRGGGTTTDAAIAEPPPAPRRRKATGRRKREGVFYTARPIVDYLVAAALEPAWDAARAAALARLGLDDADPPEGPSPSHAALARDLIAWLDALTLCDPACGSGAFLLAAYDWFEDRRLKLLSDLKAAEPDSPEAHGDPDDWRERSAPLILRHNLYGVDLSAEAVEIARLSLWLRTARRGQKLTDLTENVVQGNSVVDDSAIDPRAFAWPDRFPAVFARGGFDAVVGNPPYVRQEKLGAAVKQHLAARFRAYHGMADLFVYFYERGLNILRPGGRLAYVVTNKWMKAGYGEPLRKLFAEDAWVESVVDFGHAKQFFPDADVFPCFLVARKPDEGPPPETASVCVVPREMADLNELPARVATRAIRVGRERFAGEAWNLEPNEVGALLAKIRERGVPLAEYAGVSPLMGIKTGLNEAFLIDTVTKGRLVESDPSSAPLFKPYLRGQDIDRWHSEWAGLWMIALKSSGDHPWPWADLGDAAEACFAATYPAIHAHLSRFQPVIAARQDQGRYWWELRSCAYWDQFARPKLLYPEMSWRLQWCFEEEEAICNNTAYIIPTDDLWILAVVNSSACWWMSWRTAVHGKDEILRFIKEFVDAIPIPSRAEPSRAEPSRAEPRIA